MSKQLIRRIIVEVWSDENTLVPDTIKEYDESGISEKTELVATKVIAAAKAQCPKGFHIRVLEDE